jgi:predicted transcriptional regulator
MSESKRPEAPPYHNKHGRTLSAKELGKSHYSQLKHQLNHSLDTLIMVLRQVDEEAKSYERQIKQLQNTNQQLVEALEKQADAVDKALDEFINFVFETDYKGEICISIDFAVADFKNSKYIQMARDSAHKAITNAKQREVN